MEPGARGQTGEEVLRAAREGVPLGHRGDVLPVGGAGVTGEGPRDRDQAAGAEARRSTPPTPVLPMADTRSDTARSWPAGTVRVRSGWGSPPSVPVSRRKSRARSSAVGLTKTASLRQNAPPKPGVRAAAGNDHRSRVAVVHQRLERDVGHGRARVVARDPQSTAGRARAVPGEADADLVARARLDGGGKLPGVGQLERPADLEAGDLEVLAADVAQGEHRLLAGGGDAEAQGRRVEHQARRGDAFADQGDGVARGERVVGGHHHGPAARAEAGGGQGHPDPEQLARPLPFRRCAGQVHFLAGQGQAELEIGGAVVDDVEVGPPGRAPPAPGRSRSGWRAGPWGRGKDRRRSRTRSPSTRRGTGRC